MNMTLTHIGTGSTHTLNKHFLYRRLYFRATNVEFGGVRVHEEHLCCRCQAAIWLEENRGSRCVSWPWCHDREKSRTWVCLQQRSGAHICPCSDAKTLKTRQEWHDHAHAGASWETQDVDLCLHVCRFLVALLAGWYLEAWMISGWCEPHVRPKVTFN